MKLLVPFTFGAPGCAALDLTWDGTGGLVIDDRTKIRNFDPLTGMRSLNRDRLTGRFATVDGTVALPELGLIDVTTIPTDESYPPFLLNSASVSVQTIK